MKDAIEILKKFDYKLLKNNKKEIIFRTELIVGNLDLEICKLTKTVKKSANNVFYPEEIEAVNLIFKELEQKHGIEVE